MDPAFVKFQQSTDFDAPAADLTGLTAVVTGSNTGLEQVHLPVVLSADIQLYLLFRKPRQGDVSTSDANENFPHCHGLTGSCKGRRSEEMPAR